MYLEMKKEEKILHFEKALLETNRGYGYYVNWANVVIPDKYQVEVHALDVLIGCSESQFKSQFSMLLHKLPSVIEVFPFLFALARADREKVIKGKDLKVIGTDIDDEDFRTFNFNADVLKQDFSQELIDEYYDFFCGMGLKKLFQDLLEKSVADYITGVLVGLDSNGRKNRSGESFELACEPLIRAVCDKYGLEVLTQKKFGYLAKHYGKEISSDIENRKADFIILDRECSYVMNIEVNFYTGSGSKPEEIIDAYIRRQEDLEKFGIKFALITDGDCWRGTTNQLAKGFTYLRYLMNYGLVKNGMLEEVIRQEFGV